MLVEIPFYKYKKQFMLARKHIKITRENIEIRPSKKGQ